MKNIKKEFFTSLIIGIVVGSIVLIIFYNAISKIVVKETLQKAKLEANTIIEYRHYLAKVAPKIKITNKTLDPFAITPAYATNQVIKQLRTQKIYIKQTSDRYRNPLDKPSNSEKEAIEFFKTHPNVDEFFEIHQAGKNFKEKHLFYAKKLIIKKSCLKCHGIPYKDVPAPLYHKLVKLYGNKAFNYKIGEVRGILSIVFPYQKILNEINKIFLIISVLGFIFFIIGAYIFFKITKKIDSDIEKILNHFKYMEKNVYPPLKEKMNYIEFEKLKDQINTTFKKIRDYQGSLYKKYYHHPLTNLPNRNKFLEMASLHKYPVVLLNIDKFREINFFFGNRLGDELIKSVAKRLIEINKSLKWKLFHLDIDEFAFLVTGNLSLEDLIKELEKNIKILEKPYIIENNEILIRIRAGISYYKKDPIRADIALDKAKELRKDIMIGKEAANLEEYKNHLKWFKKLKTALENDKIVPFFQPIVDQNQNIIKYEALVRLIDEDGKVVSPFFFLDIAKKSRYYLEITKRMINKSIDKVLQNNISISVNLTLEDMEDIEIKEFILQKLSTVPDVSKITFEIVESEDVKDNKTVMEFLKQLKQKGALIYIDDFGSGYSNFDYILKLHPDGVKIDGSLIKNILKDKNSQIIVKTIISFAKEMNIKTIAEFVENEEIFNKLKEMGVDYFQGYYFSPPKEEI